MAELQKNYFNSTPTEKPNVSSIELNNDEIVNILWCLSLIQE